MSETNVMDRWPSDVITLRSPFFLVMRYLFYSTLRFSSLVSLPSFFLSLALCDQYSLPFSSGLKRKSIRRTFPSRRRPEPRFIYFAVIVVAPSFLKRGGFRSPSFWRGDSGRMGIVDGFYGAGNSIRLLAFDRPPLTHGLFAETDSKNTVVPDSIRFNSGPGQSGIIIEGKESFFQSFFSRIHFSSGREVLLLSSYSSLVFDGRRQHGRQIINIHLLRIMPDHKKDGTRSRRNRKPYSTRRFSRGPPLLKWRRKETRRTTQRPTNNGTDLCVV